MPIHSLNWDALPGIERHVQIFVIFLPAKCVHPHLITSILTIFIFNGATQTLGLSITTQWLFLQSIDSSLFHLSVFVHTFGMVVTFA